MTIIDIHAHYVPRGLPDLASRHGDERWPTLVVDDRGARIVQHGAVYRTVDETYYSLDRRLEQMDELGIDHQVLSPLPVNLVSWAEPELAREYCTVFNDLLAEAVHLHPDRFSAFGTVALQDPSLAAEQLAGFRARGLAGVEIGTWLGDQRSIDDPALAVFFESAVEADLPVLLHPNAGHTFTSGGPPTVELSVGVGSETARALASLFLVDTFGRSPGLRLCAVHGGGGFFWLWPRFRHVAGRAGAATELPPMLYVDTAGLDGRNLEYLLDLLGEDRVVFGSDIPAAGIPWTESTLKAVRGLDWDEQKVLERNARSFLGRPSLT